MYLAGTKNQSYYLNSKMMIMIPKTQLVSLLLLIAATTTAVSCKKEVGAKKEKTKMELLTSGTWKRTSFVSDPAYDWYGDGDYTTNLQSPPCVLDNFETYYTDGTW